MSNYVPTVEIRWCIRKGKQYLQQKWTDPARPHAPEWRDVGYVVEEDG